MTTYISLGDTCQPASMLRALGVRHEAFPFDWITGSGDSIVKCIETDFNGFHTNLQFNSPHLDLGMNTVLTDSLGFSFHHDYPTIESGPSTIDEEFIRETTIVPNWSDYYPTVYEKYQRRILRFRSIFRSPGRIICVCHRSMEECVRILHAIQRIYGKDALIITNSAERSLHAGVFTYVHSDNHSDFIHLMNNLNENTTNMQ
jgi:hypothetical protein